MLPTYVSREVLAAAAGVKSSAGIASQLDRVLQGASRQIDKSMHREFFPTTEAFTFEPRGFTDREFGEWGFWLDKDLLSVATITVDGTTVTTYTLQPARYGPPFGQILIASGSVYVITGDWGYSNDTVPAGAITEDLTAAETDVSVSDSSLVGVGDLLAVGSERVLVTAKALEDTTADLTGNPTAVASDDSIAVDNGALIKTGETITVGSERMLVTDVAGNNLSVDRAVDGTTLAAHVATDDVYAPRALTVERAATGTTAATHSNTDALTRFVAPAPIRDLCLAEALSTLEQERAGYVRVIGAGESAREAAGKGISDIRELADTFRRRRHGTV